MSLVQAHSQSICYEVRVEVTTPHGKTSSLLTISDTVLLIFEICDSQVGVILLQLGNVWQHLKTFLVVAVRKKRCYWH